MEKEREKNKKMAKGIVYAEKIAKEEIEKTRINDLVKINSLVNRQDLGTMLSSQFERIYNAEKKKYDKTIRKL